MNHPAPLFAAVGRAALDRDDPLFEISNIHIDIGRDLCDFFLYSARPKLKGSRRRSI